MKVSIEFLEFERKFLWPRELDGLFVEGSVVLFNFLLFLLVVTDVLVIEAVDECDRLRLIPPPPLPRLVDAWLSSIKLIFESIFVLCTAKLVIACFAFDLALRSLLLFDWFKLALSNVLFNVDLFLELVASIQREREKQK